MTQGGGAYIPVWIIAVQVGFLVYTVAVARYPALFIGGFLFFPAFAQATAHFQRKLDLRPPLLVGFFLAGLVVHGGLQSWAAGARPEEPGPGVALCLGHHSHGIQRQCRHHLPGHARSGIHGTLQVRGRRRGRHGGRSDRDRQCAEPRRAGDPAALLFRRRLPGESCSGAGADAGPRGSFHAALGNPRRLPHQPAGPGLLTKR